MSLPDYMNETRTLTARKRPIRFSYVLTVRVYPHVRKRPSGFNVKPCGSTRVVYNVVRGVWSIRV